MSKKARNNVPPAENEPQETPDVVSAVEPKTPEAPKRNIFNQPVLHDPSKSGIGFGDAQ